MPRLNISSIAKWMLMLGLALIISCTEEQPFYPADPNSLTVVATQIDGRKLEEGKEGVKVLDAFTVIFSQSVNPEVASNATTLRADNGEVAMTISFNDNQSIMALTPNDSLDYETDYTLSISSGELGLMSENLATAYSLSFQTEIEPKPIFAAGTGVNGDPYLIESAEQLDLVRLFLSSEFVLINDIDLGGYLSDPAGWIPLGNLAEPFVGKFDGGGFTVSGLNIDRPDITELGLFGVLDGSGEIRNLQVQSTGISGGQATAALLGRQLNGLVENCHSAGSVTSTSSRTGGLVGSQEAGSILKSSSSCGVFGTLSRAGGLVGLSQAGLIAESYATGNVESLSSRVGGLVGSLEENATVRDCYATGNVTAKNRGGGLLGRLDGSATRSYAIGNITITDADASGDYPGNVVGQLGGTGSFQDLYYPNNQVINYGGQADITNDGTALDITTLSCASPNALFTGFDFATVWACASDGTWVQLAWQ
ncbi:MAG: GLUG motif-containing protein [Bacteroidota bacterium]